MGRHPCSKMDLGGCSCLESFLARHQSGKRTGENGAEEEHRQWHHGRVPEWLSSDVDEAPPPAGRCMSGRYDAGVETWSCISIDGAVARIRPEKGRWTALGPQVRPIKNQASCLEKRPGGLSSVEGRITGGVNAGSSGDCRASVDRLIEAGSVAKSKPTISPSPLRPP